MVHIQNATLAGGFAIGSAANLSFPAGAVAVSGVAGILSTAGFRYERVLCLLLDVHHAVRSV